MSRFGFNGPSYQSQSIIADAERLVNMYFERIESENGMTAGALYPSPGTSLFAVLPETGIRGLIFHDATGRAFGIAGSGIYEVTSAGVVSSIGAVANDGLPASLAQSNTQLMIASGLHGYCYTLASNTLTTDPANLTSPRQVIFDDDFFLAFQANSNQFQYSDALDGTTWNALNVSGISVWPDEITGIQFDHREAIIFGQKRSVAYYDSGNTFTFDVVPGAYIDDGLIATFAKDRIDNTTYYLGLDERGNIMAKKLSGYTPQRISNHAVETKWRGYSSVSDAVSYSFGFNGHSFWRVTFPSANSGRGATWDYDVSTGMWNEICFLSNGEEYAHRSRCHIYAFGKHLVGDPNSGNIYELNDTFSTDAGNPIRRERVTPPIVNEGMRIKHSKLQIYAEMGVSTITDPDGTERAPSLVLQWSDDGGKTWGNEHWRDLASIGQYQKRAIWNQLGQARQRNYRMRFTDDAPLRIVDAFLDAPGWGRIATPRLADKLRQQA